MKKSYLWVITILSILLLTGLTSFVLIEQKNSTEQLTQVNELAERQMRLFNAEKDLYRNSLQGNYFLQDHDLKLFGKMAFFTEDSDTVYASDLFTKEKLVFRFSENNCSECVKHEFELLEQYVDRIGAENMVIIADYSQNQYLEYVKQDAPEKIRCLNDTHYFRKLPFERFNLPYLLTINEKLELRNLVILEKSFDQFTHDYLTFFLMRNAN